MWASSFQQVTPAEEPGSSWRALLPSPSSFSFFLQTPTSFLYCLKPQDNKLRSKHRQTVSGKVCEERWTSAPRGSTSHCKYHRKPLSCCLHNRAWCTGVLTPKWRRLVKPLVFSSLFWSSHPSLPLLQPQWLDPTAQGLWHGALLLLGAPRSSRN